MIGLGVRDWPIASFRCDAEFGRHPGIADIAGLAGGQTPSRMTLNGHAKIRRLLKRVLNCIAGKC
jgi:hypothetical protein